MLSGANTGSHRDTTGESPREKAWVAARIWVALFAADHLAIGFLLDAPSGASIVGWKHFP
jgi:hypothetical protein